MAATAVSSECKQCKVNGCKRQSSALCYHCNRNVFKKHFVEHTDETTAQLNPLSDSVNELYSKFHNLTVNEKRIIRRT
ncbi:unnamed protein product [Didymodactylos carnosus]|uniref:Uncharacterized protein n=1 Tax=Didymodactylos carnosus TaxID=1234261 RepID=A0A814FST7_9BILA|nr:unnamed protein product [Didymodactylos carnosus]CAF0985366.1 unnamed protein product [Didymodactylos carnosus]CAF3551712.1 unnamed protein product [Didymodactylos carnosus]CAF3757625.1 unnamed protein product [Didymodactylos carnosus]